MAGKARKFFPKNTRAVAKNNWGRIVGYVSLLMVWVFSSIIASQDIFRYSMLWILGPEKLSQPVWATIYIILSYSFAMFLIIFIPKEIARKRAETKKLKVEKGNTRNELGLRGLPTWTDIGLAPAGFIVYLILATGLVALFSVFPWFDAEQAQDVGFNTYIAGFDRILAFLTLVVVAPIAEEIIFRGWLYGKMRAKFNEKISDLSSMIISIFLVSLLFGIVHMQWNVGVNVFAMSVVLCGLREITGTIYAGILLHMLKNGVAFYVLYVCGGVL